jgi:L-ascorbate metabolism protein UlaG (beta-lactamase superfamily)
VLLTHSHYDHLDRATLRRLHARHRPRIVAPLGVDKVVRPLAADTADWWDTIALSDTVSATLTPANHWSSRTPWDRRRTLWCGYALHTPSGLVYLAGDTAFGDGRLFPELRARLGAPLAAILPIGAYEPRWFMAAQHMNPAEAVHAFDALGATQGLGVHWGTFQLTDEAQHHPPAALDEALADRGIPPARFRALRPAETWSPA